MKEALLYLVHRIPFPPNKGDKLRSHHLLRHLAARYRVFLGTFVDCEEDERHVSALAEYCQAWHVERLRPAAAKVRSLAGLVKGEALTLGYYRDDRMHRWVAETVAREKIGKALVFSSAMAQYVRGLPGMHTVIDFVDVDSAKWAQYAGERGWPSSFVFRREGRRLLAFEREAASTAAACVLVTPAEAAMFAKLAPECAAKLHSIQNGVDSQYFAPQAERPSPFAATECPVVFTGVMDYWPNVDAAAWFARDVLPLVAQERPEVRFYVVGMNPTSTVRALATDPRVVVTGMVPDVRPYLQYAAAVVAPLRVARGVQNKVLEAMAMERPVVASAAAAAGVVGTPGVEFESALDGATFAAKLKRVFDPAIGVEMGRRARRRVQASYSWSANLEAFDGLLHDHPVQRNDSVLQGRR